MAKNKSGIMGRKLGMTQIFNEDGTTEAVTAIEAGPCTVVGLKTADKEGYNAVKLGFGKSKQAGASRQKQLKGEKQFKYLREFGTGDFGDVEIGQNIDVSIFKTGDIVEITGTSKGKGFAGVIKRHHFRGGPKTHGQSDRHRAPGSVGAGSSPGRVLKGLRMAGHMGQQQVTERRVEVFTADPERNLLLVKGAVPGAKNGLLLIRKSGREK